LEHRPGVVHISLTGLKRPAG